MATMHRPHAAQALSLVLVALVAAPLDTGSRRQRKELHEELVRRSLATEAETPQKTQRLALDYQKAAEELGREMGAADGDDELFFVLQKLSNARCTRELEIGNVEGGLREFDTWMEAPIRFRADHHAVKIVASAGASGKDDDEHPSRLFVCDWANDVEQYTRGYEPAIGDVVLEINGDPVDEYLAKLRPFLRYSSTQQMWDELAREASRKTDAFDPDLYERKLELQLETPRGRKHKIELPYRGQMRNEWTRLVSREYPGFTSSLASPTLELFEHRSEDVVLIRCFGFGETLEEDVASVIAYAGGNDRLEHDVILDLSRTFDGERGLELVRHVVGEPFRVPLRELRVSEALEPYTAALAEDARPDDPLLTWLRTEARAAKERGDAYTPPIPFDLDALPIDSDGKLEPAPTRFKGRLVCLYGPLENGSGGGELDRVLATIVDNGLGHFIGAPPAGNSPAFVWTQTLVLPGTDKPIVSWQWALGRTLRPNGEPLEGNPARPHEALPVAYDTYSTWTRQAVERALAHLEEGG